MDIVEILRAAPQDFNIQDALTKCNSMINSRQYQHILCMLPSSVESEVIMHMVKLLDFSGKVDYEPNSEVTYDLILGPERHETTTSYAECAGNGLYRPVFWFDEKNLQNYLLWASTGQIRGE